ncbi:MAG: ROK family protein [Streptosporangiales bacterium]|nr:ROK family protein [Streptosporangiales bacterium]
MPSAAPGSQSSLREANRRRVIEALRSAGVLTQAEIARATGLSAATVSNVVRDLSVSGAIAVRPTARGGRRAREVRLSRSTGVAVGVDFGKRHLRIALCDLARQVIAEDELPLPSDHAAPEGIAEVDRLLDRLLGGAGIARDQIVGVALGLPGPIDTRTGYVGSTSILPGWTGVQAGTALGERLGLPVLVDNDANLGALGEVTWGAGRGARHAAYIKVSNGIGAGLIVDGRIFRGATGTAGEVGHTTIDENGRVCRCGNRGCLETLASAPVLLEMLRDSHGGALTPSEMLRLAEGGDPACRRVIADAGRHIGVAVANLCNVFNPERVIVGGDLTSAGELLLAPVCEAVDRFAIPSAAGSLSIVSGVLGHRAEVLGALALVLQECRPPAVGEAKYAK